MKSLLKLLLLTIISISVNAQNNSYANPWSNTDFNSKTISLTTVGSTPGSASVSSGSASYVIPLHVPPGTNGVVPSLSVSYNSMSGNGTLGMGWSLSGLSMISRAPKNRYLDGVVSAVEINNNDRFALDGSLILPTSGLNGADLSEYKTESENFSKVISHTIEGIEGPGWFEVITKDGLKMEFGKTADSRRVTVYGQPRILFWKLNRIIHPDNNFIDYVYESLNGDLRIKLIKYTGHINPAPDPESSPYQIIVFNYLENRKDPILVYEAGEKINNKSLITTISTNAKTYTFKYASKIEAQPGQEEIDNINSFLKEIIEEEVVSSVQLNSTIFKYGDLPAEITRSNTPLHNGTPITFTQDTDLFPGDFNGDGYTDIIAAPKSYNDGDDYRYYTNFSVYKKIPETDSYEKFGPFAFEANFTVINKKKTNDKHNYLARDFTGDGRDDILTVQTSASGTTRDLIKLKLFKSSEVNGVLNFDSISIPIPSGGYTKINNTNNFMFSGDYDGDGFQDIILILGNNTGQYKIYLKYGNGNHVSICYNILDNTVLPSCFVDLGTLSTYLTNEQIAAGVINIIDFDGDGKDDIMVTNGNKTQVLTLQRFYDSTSNLYYSFTINSLYTFDSSSILDSDLSGLKLKSSSLIYFGDFNGDRKTDLFIRKDNNTISANWVIGLSNGKGFEVQAFAFPTGRIPNTVGYSLDQLSLADFNGDGKTDIFHATIGGDPLANTLIYNYYSRGDGTFYAAPIQINANRLLGSTGNNYVYDANGDGRPDIITLSSYTQPFDILHIKKDGKENLLEKIKTGNGQITEFKYKRINEGGSFYSQGDMDQYDVSINPINNIRLPINCVSAFKNINGIGGINTTTYNYEQAKLHKSGKGLLGFYKITSISDATLNNTFRLKTIDENKFLINAAGASPKTFYISLPYKSSNYLTSNFGTETQANELLSETTFTNSIVDLGLNRYYLKLDQVEVNNVFEKRKSITSNTYDAFGNVIANTERLIARKTDNTADEDLETTNTITVFGKFPDVGIDNKPTLVTISKTRKDQNTYSVKNFASYNTIGQVDYKIDFYETQKAVKTKYTYDEKNIPNSTNKYSLGNIVKTTVSSVPLAGNTSDFTTRETSTTYDTYGRFPTSTTNELGQTSTIISEENWGNPTSITGADGLTTTMEYDGFGRIIKTTYPTGFFTTQKYEWLGTTGLYKLTNDTFETSTPTLAKGKPKTITYFDILGREFQKEVEGFKSSSSDDNIFTGQIYDRRGNISTILKPSKGPISLSNINNVYDKYNRIIEINSTNTVFGNTLIEYSAYTIDGKQTITTKEPDFTTANNKLSSKTTDATGKLYSATDNGGTLLYTYNSQGNLTHVNSGTVASPIYNTISDFDIYGRQTSIIDLNAGTTTYIYNGIGQLVSETNPKGNTLMNYDIGGRVTSRVTSEGTTTYEYYDAMDDPLPSKKKLKKVTNFVVGNTEEYVYDAFGRIYKSIDKIDSKDFNTFHSYNNFNDIVSKRYPNNLLIDYEYDDNGYLEYIRNDADKLKFIYKATEMNAYGQFNKYNLGNGKSSETTYYEGMPTNFNTIGVQNLTLQWNYKNGNLEKRTNNLNTRVEDFTYDNLDRLTIAKVVGQNEYKIGYEPNGNIYSKTGIGIPYKYNINAN